MSKKNSRIKENGFTLLELLAVVVIIGIVISIASISIGQKSSHVVQEETERLNALLHLASEEAVLQSRELALEFGKAYYTFLELGNDNQWLPIEDDKLFHQRSLPDEITVDLIIEGASASFDDEKNLPRVFVLSSGELTPFTLTLTLEDEDSYTLQGLIDGRLTLMKTADNAIDV